MSVQAHTIGDYVLTIHDKDTLEDKWISRQKDSDNQEIQAAYGD